MSVLHLQVRDQLKSTRLIRPEFQPQLVAVAVGNHPASNIYLARKAEAAQFCGLHFSRVSLDVDVSLSYLLSLLSTLNSDPAVSGVIVQLPLPAHLPELVVCNAVLPSKDVDGFTSTNLGKLVQAVDRYRNCSEVYYSRPQYYVDIFHLANSVVGAARAWCRARRWRCVVS